jgi:hypothetical protein
MRRMGLGIYGFAVVAYCVGATFAYVLPVF